MQPGDDEHAVQHAVGEQPDRLGAEHRLAGGVHAALERLPAEAEDQREHQPGEAADDGHEAAAAEERQVARQADVAEAVVGPAGDQPGQQAHGHAELGQFLGAKRRGGQVPSTARECWR